MLDPPRILAAAGIALIACAAVSASQGAPQAQTPTLYDIKFERHFQTGQSFALTVTDTLRSNGVVLQPDGDTAKSGTFRRVMFEGDVTIEHVNAAGREDTLTVKIKKLSLQKISDTAPESLPEVVLMPGTELSIRYDATGDTTYIAKSGQSISADATEALRQVFRPHRELKTTDDDKYGTKERKKVGDSWPVNVDALSPDKTAAQMLDPAQTSGTVTLKAIKDVGGVRCEELEVRLASKHMIGLEAKEYVMDVTMTLLLPLEVKMPAVARNSHTTTHVVSETTTLGGKVRRETADVELTHEATWSPK